MFLIPEQALVNNLNPFYQQFISGSQLLGYFPCQNTDELWSQYYSCLTLDGKHRVVPVFYAPKMSLGAQNDVSALFFRGCDDGSLALRMQNIQEALNWIDNCPYVDFESLFRAHAEGKTDFQFDYYN